MNYYFLVLYRTVKRSVEDAGCPMPIGVVVLFFVFFILYRVLLSVPENIASYVIAGVDIYILLLISSSLRNDFLKSIFEKNKYFLIRFFENTISTCGLIIISTLLNYWIVVLWQFLLIFLFTFNSVLFLPKIVILTPFKKYSFEFIIFFRRFWIGLSVFYFLAVAGLYYNNFNLTVAALFTLLLLSLSAYDIIEGEYIIWNSRTSPVRFIQNKIKTGVLNIVILGLPIILPLLGLFNDSFWFIILVLLIIFALLVLIIFMKYALFPCRMGVIEVLVLTAAVAIPGLILIIYHYYFKKAKINLSKFL